jgi:hypothetical protein
MTCGNGNGGSWKRAAQAVSLFRHILPALAALPSEVILREALVRTTKTLELTAQAVSILPEGQAVFGVVDLQAGFISMDLPLLPTSVSGAV